MKLPLRIPLTLTVIVVVTGIIAFVKRAAQGKPYPTSYLILWIAASVILLAITIWKWTRNRKKA